MNCFIKQIVVLTFGTSILMAIPIELFKSKNGAYFNHFVITMKAKINHIDCQDTLSYNKIIRHSCKVLAQHQMKAQSDRNIYLIFDNSYKKKLLDFMRQGNYHFVSCIYMHKKHLMLHCTIK